MTSYNITQDVAVIGFEAYGFAGCQNPGKGRSPSLSARTKKNPLKFSGFSFFTEVTRQYLGGRSNPSLSAP